MPLLSSGHTANRWVLTHSRAYDILTVTMALSGAALIVLEKRRARAVQAAKPDAAPNDNATLDGDGPGSGPVQERPRMSGHDKAANASA
jgi:hypothetical protein